MANKFLLWIFSCGIVFVGQLSAGNIVTQHSQESADRVATQPSLESVDKVIAQNPPEISDNVATQCSLENVDKVIAQHSLEIADKDVTQHPQKMAPKECYRGFAYAEFLYMKPSLDGLEYGTSLRVTYSANEPPVHIKIKPKNLNFEWSPGSKIGIGCLSPTDWDLSLSWTYLMSHAKGFNQSAPPVQSQTSAIFEQFRINWISNGTGGTADSASSHWSCKLNVLDLALGKKFSIGSGFTLHPYIGLRGAWIDQNLSARYHAEFNYILESQQASIPFDSSVKFRQNFGAGGILGGGDFSWNFISDWSVWADFSFSLLYGQFRLKEHLLGASLNPTGNGTAPSLSPQDDTAVQKYERGRTNVDGTIGLQWARNFNKRQLLLAVGYQISQWFNQNEFINFLTTVDSTPQSDDGSVSSDVQSLNLLRNSGVLAYQGVIAKAQFIF